MVSDERGQLILVGAIAIALIVLGLVLIVNTALFTQVVGSEGTVESAKEGGVTGQEVGDAIGAVIAEENRNGGGSESLDDLDALERGLRNQSLESTGSFVSLAYLGENESGTLIEQDSEALTDDDDGDDWSPVTNGDVGEFLLTIDTDDIDGGDFEVTVNSTSTISSRTLDVTVVSSDKVTLSGAGAQGCTDIQTSDGTTIRLDVRHGAVYESSDCQFDLFGDGPAPYNVSFDGGDDIYATYSIATDQTGFSDPHPEGDEIIWSFEYSFTYDSPDATVESDSRVIDVYD